MIYKSDFKDRMTKKNLKVMKGTAYINKMNLSFWWLNRRTS